MTAPASPKKKLIEVALPLEAINAAAAREKSIRHGHPSTLHLWWARRPLAACRAILFASLVDAPCSDPKLPEEQATRKRKKLFDLIEDLVKWENSNNPEVLARARAAIMESTDNHPPPVLDPFCGGGSIPLEAQRLGLEAHASDLNPVAVLITKALIEIPPKFAGRPPINPADRANIGSQTNWPGATGLAADVRHYGKWMRDEAERRIGHLYPKATLPPALGGGEATVIAWLWARTVTCPNPACRARMPLVSSFWLSTKAGRKTWVEPVVDHAAKTVQFETRCGAGAPPSETVTRKGARCIVCETHVPFAYVRSEGRGGRMSQRLMAVVAEGRRGRIYLSPSQEHVEAAERARPTWTPDAELPHNPRDFKTPNYGLTTFADLFTPRQLVALTTFSDLVGEARERVRGDAVAADLADDGVALADGGADAPAYADAVATYLAFAIDKAADRNTSLCSWESGMDRMRNTFGRQALPMVWDYTETNPLGGAGGDLRGAVASLCEALEVLPARTQGIVFQMDATNAEYQQHVCLCTDPPYYDNIGYADLSDFFYIWLRRSIGRIYPRLFGTLLTPKAQELVATPYRFNGSREEARRFFEEGLRRSFHAMQRAQHADYPLTVQYAFKQTESEEIGVNGTAAVVSTGWETMLQGLLDAGLAVTGTWPMRTELANRMVGRGTNALASSIALVCRPLPENAPVATRSEFIRALKRELPQALRMLQQGNIAPVDLAQAAIGPGMAVFSRYKQILEPNGDPLRVRAALSLINQALDEVLTEQDSDYDADTRWAIAWFEQHGMAEGHSGEAETLCTAKACSIGGLIRAGVVASRAGKTVLRRRDQLSVDWDPRIDRHLTVWETTQHLIHALDQEAQPGAARVLAKVGAQGEIARDLAYRLYTVSERKGRTDEARAYNSLVVAWPDIAKIAADLPTPMRQEQFV